MTTIAVLGSGMAGWGAAHRLAQDGIRPVMFDKNPQYGGHTSSFRFEGGFLFDLGPHISFTKVERMQALFAEQVDQRFESVQIHLNNYWQGHWPTHPVQLHLHGLPEDLVVQVITDFVAEQQRGERPIANYADWLLASFGRTFAEQFPMRYTRKYHTTPAENLSTDWLGPRIYRPSLEEVLHGALSSAAPHKHYITHFRYPSEGGFMSYLHKFAPLVDLNLGHEVVRVDPRAAELTFRDGRRASFDGLVSSIPLPDLIPMIAGAPDEVREAAARLACSTCVLVNVGVDRADLSQAHMTYFYDEDVSFSRISFPHMLSATNCPPGTGSIQCEVYFSRKYKPLAVPPESLIDPVIADLQRTGVLRADDRVLFRNAMVLPYANVIFDLERAASLALVHGYLDELGIGYCGRYGDWGYMWTDESFMSGERAAEATLACCR